MIPSNPVLVIWEEWLRPVAHNQDIGVLWEKERLGSRLCARRYLTGTQHKVDMCEKRGVQGKSWTCLQLSASLVPNLGDV